MEMAVISKMPIANKLKGEQNMGGKKCETQRQSSEQS